MTSQIASPNHVVGIDGEATTEVIPATENNAARNETRHISASILEALTRVSPAGSIDFSGSLEIINPGATRALPLAVDDGLQASRG